FVYINKNNMPRISDGNIDIHGRYKFLFFLIQCKWLSPRYKIEVKVLREFLNTIAENPQFIGFLVSNVELGEYALKELKDSLLKDRICVCFYYEIVDKIKEHAEILKIKQDKDENEKKENKRKFTEIEAEIKFLRRENKKIKEERNEKYEKKIEELQTQINDLEEKLETQNREIKERLENQTKQLKKQNRELKEKLE
ncbi:12713_t:CDS:2, partial [Dentiscutata heterogama]